jgi:hypothetical protein
MAGERVLSDDTGAVLLDSEGRRRLHDPNAGPCCGGPQDPPDACGGCVFDDGSGPVDSTPAQISITVTDYTVCQGCRYQRVGGGLGSGWDNWRRTTLHVNPVGFYAMMWMGSPVLPDQFRDPCWYVSQTIPAAYTTEHRTYRVEQGLDVPPQGGCDGGEGDLYAYERIRRSLTFVVRLSNLTSNLFVHWRAEDHYVEHENLEEPYHVVYDPIPNYEIAKSGYDRIAQSARLDDYYYNCHRGVIPVRHEVDGDFDGSGSATWGDDCCIEYASGGFGVPAESCNYSADLYLSRLHALIEHVPRG